MILDKQVENWVNGFSSEKQSFLRAELEGYTSVQQVALMQKILWDQIEKALIHGRLKPLEGKSRDINWEWSRWGCRY